MKHRYAQNDTWEIVLGMTEVKIDPLRVEGTLNKGAGGKLKIKM